MPSGKTTTYTNTNTQKRGVSDAISIIAPMQVPLLKALGYGASNIRKFRLVNFPSTMYEWIEDTYAARSDQLNEALDTVETDVDVDDGTKFQIGDVIEVDSEQMWVSAIATNTLTVTRAYGGTTAATHADNTAVYIRTQARLEGAAANDSPTTNPTAPYNYTQIFQGTVEVTRTRSKVTQYGIEDEFDYQLAKKYEELAIKLNNVAYYGKRNAGSATAPRSAGGLQHFITTNISTLTNSPKLKQGHIEDVVEDCWDNGGKPNLLVCGAYATKAIRDMYAPNVRTERDETRGGIMIDRILVPPVGWLSLLTDRHCPTTKIFVLDDTRVGWIPFDEFFDEELAKTGDAMKSEVIGEYGFVVVNEKAHGVVSGFSLTK